MSNPHLQAALFGEDGETPAKITRIEMEILESGNCRWTLWSDARRLFSIMAKPADVPVMMRATKDIVATEMAVRREAN